MRVDRVVTMLGADNKGVFTLSGPAPVAVDLQSIPGFSSALIWATDGSETVPGDGTDLSLRVTSFLPNTGGTRFAYLQLPPDSVYASADFDPVAAGKEQAEKLPGLAELMDPNDPGMHITDTLDYVVVLEGEVCLDLGNGQERRLGKHEAIVQTGTRHAWRNKSDKPALIASVLIGVPRAR